MIIGLRFITLDGIEVIFYPHEILRIAEQIMSEILLPDPAPLPNGHAASLTAAIENPQKPAGVPLETYIESLLVENDPLEMRTPQEWLHYSQRLAKSNELQIANGKWGTFCGTAYFFNFGKDHYPLYVGDTGSIGHIQTAAYVIAHELSWIKKLSIWERCTVETGRDDIRRPQINRSTAEKSAITILRHRAQGTFVDLQIIKNKMDGFFDMEAFLLTSLRNYFCEHFTTLPPIDANPDIFKISLVAHAASLRPSERRPFFTPDHYSDEQVRGPQYHFLYSELADLLSKYESNSSVIADYMRQILQGYPFEERFAVKLEFVPLLTLAWFVSEPGRSSLSFFSGLMLLDLIENGIKEYDQDGEERYSFKHTLMHPKNDSPKETILDIYGKECKVIKWGGSHPMAHKKSASQTKTVSEEVEPANPRSKPHTLNVVQQKTSLILFRWLFEMLNFLNELTATGTPPFDIIPIILSLDAEHLTVAEPFYHCHEIGVGTEQSKALQTAQEHQNQIQSQMVIDLEELEHAEREVARLERKLEIQHNTIEPLFRNRLTTFGKMTIKQKRSTPSFSTTMSAQAKIL